MSPTAPTALRIAIVLPPGSLFDAQRPNSMETVVRTLTAHRAPHEDIRIFCETGAADHGTDLTVQTFDRDAKGDLVQALRQFDPHLVEFHQHVIFATKLAKHLPGVATMAYRHNAMKPPRHGIDRWRYERRYSRIDRFIFVSQSEHRIFSRNFPALSDRGVAVPNAIRAENWLAEPSERERLIVFSGRAMKEKGVAEVCAALPAVLDAAPDWKATLLLNDWEQHKDWAAPHVAPLARYGERVEILHSVPLAEVQALMKRADIALTPSLWDEPLGLTALEAHAAGAALISSGRGGLKEASGPHALYVDPVTPEGLAKAMLTLIGDPQARLKLARDAQAFVQTEHTPQHRAEQLAQIRLDLVAAKQAKGCA